MGVVTSPGELCLLLDVAISDPQGNGEKVKNPKGDVTQLVVGVFINSSLLVVPFVSCVSDSQFSNCPMKLKLGDITERRFFTYS